MPASPLPMTRTRIGGARRSPTCGRAQTRAHSRVSSSTVIGLTTRPSTSALGHPGQIGRVNPIHRRARADHRVKTERGLALVRHLFVESVD